MESKIYLQLVPTDGSRKRLQTIADQLKGRVAGIPTDPQKWHVTILHFGGAEHVFHDLRRELPNLGKTVFEKHLNDYLIVAKVTLPGEMELQPIGLSIFGINRSVVGIEFKPTEEFTSSHEQAVKDLKIFLGNCGIQNTENFMRSSINFRWALSQRPHITFLRGAKNPNLDDLDINLEPMSFQAGEIHGL